MLETIWKKLRGLAGAKGVAKAPPGETPVIRRENAARCLSVPAPSYDPHAQFDFRLGPGSLPPVDAAIQAFIAAPGAVDATLYCAGERGYVMRHVTDAQSMSQCLLKSSVGRPRITESSFSSGDYPDLTGGPQAGTEFTQLLMGPLTRQQYLYDYLKMHAQAWYAWTHDPVAKRIVRFYTDFVFGDPPKVRVTKGEQETWDDYATDNDLWKRCATWNDELSIYGELFIAIGATPLVSIDPSTVLEIVTEPDDIERVYYYHVQYPTQYQTYVRDGVKSSDYILRQVPADQVLHVKINSVSNEKRGRSELLPVLGWLKMLRDYITWDAIKKRNESAFTWDVKIDGSADDVAAFQAKSQGQPLPQPGSEYIHNAAVTRTPITPTIARASVANTADWILAMIANGAGIPMGYFATPAEVATTRASALIQTEPVARAIKSRQVIWERVLIRLAARIGLEIEVVFPELYPENRADKLNQLRLAETQGWLSRQTAAEMASRELGITAYDYDTEARKVARDAASVMPVWARGGETAPADQRGPDRSMTGLAGTKKTLRQL